MHGGGGFAICGCVGGWKRWRSYDDGGGDDLWARPIELGPRARAFVSPTVGPTPDCRRAAGMDPCAGHHHPLVHYPATWCEEAWGWSANARHPGKAPGYTTSRSAYREGLEEEVASALRQHGMGTPHMGWRPLGGVGEKTSHRGALAMVQMRSGGVPSGAQSSCRLIVTHVRYLKSDVKYHHANSL